MMNLEHLILPAAAIGIGIVFVIWWLAVGKRKSQAEPKPMRTVEVRDGKDGVPF